MGPLVLKQVGLQYHTLFCAMEIMISADQNWKKREEQKEE
jgi:hypothetical protein